MPCIKPFHNGLKSITSLEGMTPARQSLKHLLLIWLAAGSLGKSSAESLLNFTIIDFLQDVQRLHGFANVLLMRNRNGSIAESFMQYDAAAASEKKDFSEIIMNELQVPVLQLNELTSFFLRQQFTDRQVSVVSISTASLDDHAGLLKRLVANLRHMTLSPVLFLLNIAAMDEQFLERLFTYCWQQKMINVVALFADYQETATFYSYTHFPVFSLEAKRITVDVIDRQAIYPYRLGDLKGFQLPYIVGGSDPRIIVYENAAGETVIAGFASHFMHAFARKHNCRLVQPLPVKVGVNFPSQDLIAAVRNETVVISVAMTFPSIPVAGYTYPYEQLNWCLMLPVEPDVPAYDFYLFVFETSAAILTGVAIVLISSVLSWALYRNGYRPDLLDVLLHDNCLRGLLGQSFSEIAKPPKIVRFIYLQICVLGMLLTTSYNAYFATYVTSAPKEVPLRSFDDVLHSGIKVFVFEPEYKELFSRVAEFQRYKEMFHKEANFRQYLRTRDSFDTQYIYMVPTTKRIIVNEQQKFFSRLIFRPPEDLCFYHNIPMVFPVHDNSIFMQTLNRLMLETAQSGLTDYWRQNGFSEMIAAGKLSFADLSARKEYAAMTVDSLRYIWCGLAFLLVLVVGVFAAEVLTFNRRRIGRILRRSLEKMGGGRRPWR